MFKFPPTLANARFRINITVVLSRWELERRFSSTVNATKLTGCRRKRQRTAREISLTLRPLEYMLCICTVLSYARGTE